MAKHKKKNAISANFTLGKESILGGRWVSVYETDADFEAKHYEAAMSNLIREPNINSTVLMRADILKENTYDIEKGDSTFVSKLIHQFPEFKTAEENDGEVLYRYLDDVQLRGAETEYSKIRLNVKSELIRRLIPRNPFKDHIINQTCLLLSSKSDASDNKNSKESILVVYIPHIHSLDEVPFYLPPVYAVGLLFHDGKLSVHYIPFGVKEDLTSMDSSERCIRIALRLLQTSHKHSLGSKEGYEKRVKHDQIVSKVAFQNRYIALKKKYSSTLVNNWCESTDPKKHVFEDIAIAAFLIELWQIKYNSKDEFEFRDLGCGNGLLVYILIREGYIGQGIDARTRKSWSTYPEEVQASLKEQIIIPGVLLEPHPAVSKLAPGMGQGIRQFMVFGENSSVEGIQKDNFKYHTEAPVACYTSASLVQSSFVCTTSDFPKNTFIIGNHSDELTCWMPLLGFPFVVIPCCSHALSGAKVRYASSRNTSPKGTSSYSALVDHVEYLSNAMGWHVEKEMLRIPSTRNAAIVACHKRPQFANEDVSVTRTRVLDIMALEGGADAWVHNAMALMKKPPRNH